VIGTAGGAPLLKLPVLADAAFQALADHPLTLAATILPAHVHWLLSDSRALSTTVGRYKSVVAAKVRGAGRARRLWQRSFWDHVVRDSEKLDRIARYVLENPVRAGLCERYEDYPYVVLFADRIDAVR
jgi:REP element-mobilizing transposase RayT